MGKKGQKLIPFHKFLPCPALHRHLNLRERKETCEKELVSFCFVHSITQKVVLYYDKQLKASAGRQPDETAVETGR